MDGRAHSAAPKRHGQSKSMRSEGTFQASDRDSDPQAAAPSIHSPYEIRCKSARLDELNRKLRSKYGAVVQTGAASWREACSKACAQREPQMKSDTELQRNWGVAWHRRARRDAFENKFPVHFEHLLHCFTESLVFGEHRKR